MGYFHLKIMSWIIDYRKLFFYQFHFKITAASAGAQCFCPCKLQTRKISIAVNIIFAKKFRKFRTSSFRQIFIVRTSGYVHTKLAFRTGIKNILKSCRFSEKLMAHGIPHLDKKFFKSRNMSHTCKRLPCF